MRVAAVVLVVAASAATAGVGYRLSGALRQVNALAGGAARAVTATPAAPPLEVGSPPSLPPAPLAARPEPVDEEASAREPVARFDADAAVREAADRDANVAELLGD